MSHRPSPIIIVAVLLTNLPLSLGAAAGPQPNDDDFPPLTDSSVTRETEAVYCTFKRGDPKRTSHAYLSVSVGKSGLLETKSVICPATAAFHSFESRFSAIPCPVCNRAENLFTYMMFRSPNDTHKFQFDARPPPNTGLDPLKKVGEPAVGLLREKMTALATAVTKLRLPPFHSLVTDKLLRDRPDGKKALAELKDVCCTVKLGMIGEFGSFYGACDTYVNSSEAAVETAWNKRWQFRQYGGIRHITRPDPNMKEGGEKESTGK
ncbi:hypothetical protein FOZ63_032836 [Perkinsus olseni]|uniref:Uncharacterized protein n=1 Tax=Perkinsus olseni TaxID=32597 RepID=A0A7J6NUF8_PEROL|nr:hypothetical protein FOZ62_019939 [Perkinsus olseni]KAF4735175.1 hypothetical protein FOZ63_032836 [Perkinsus olseni]